MSVDATTVKLDYACAIVDWVLDTGDSLIASGDLARALELNKLAAMILSLQNRDLSNARIESNLQSFARSFPEQVWQRAAVTRAPVQEVWLHVLSTALPYGGHTAMAQRWIASDHHGGRVHSVALTAQTVPIPERFLDAVRKRGGEVYTADLTSPPLGRAHWLRTLANRVATRVVLHIDPSDLVPGVAFGVPGGPPVLLVNHAAHYYWSSGSVVDLVVNCRGSRLEESWTRIHRGIERVATVPIPLVPPVDGLPSAAVGQANRKIARERMGVPPDAFVILTVGDSFKYAPFDKLDFVEVAERILRALPDAWLLAVGINEDERWRNASQRTGGRLRALGRQHDVGAYHLISDLYIEGFPFGSTTALLEAGIRGIPVVLAPDSCPPPYGTDGVALDDLVSRPGSVEAYVRSVVDLRQNDSERCRLGREVAGSIVSHHSGAGWQEYVEAAASLLPDEHAIYGAPSCVRTTVEAHSYWTEFIDTRWKNPFARCMDACIARMLEIGVRPRLTKSLVDACKRANHVRRERTVPLPLVAGFCKAAVPLIPCSVAHAAFQQVASRCWPGSRTTRLLGAFVPDASW